MSFAEGYNNAGMMLFDFNKSFEEGRQRRRDQNMRDLAAAYYSGRVPQERMNDFLGDVARNGGDPRLFQQDMESGKQRLRGELGRGAAFVLAAGTPEARAQAYATLRPRLQPITQEFGVELPEAWSDDLMEEVQTIASMFGGREASDYKPMNVSPGGAVVDPRSGREIYSNSHFAPQRPVYDSNRGGWAMPPNGLGALAGGNSTPPQGGLAGLMSRPQEQQPPVANQPERRVSFDFAPGTSPDVMAATRAYAGADMGGGPMQDVSAGGGGGFLPVAPPKPDYESERLRIAQEANDRAGQAARDAAEARRRQAFGTAPAGQRFREDGSLEDIPGYNPRPAPGAGDSKPDQSAAAMAQDAINYAAAMLGKSPEEMGKLTPEAIRDAIKSKGQSLGGTRWSSGPVAARIGVPFTNLNMGTVANADLEAYANSAAGKQARLNNPTGPVTNADFDIGRKSVFSPEKPDEVNADLIYQALTWKRRKQGQAQGRDYRSLWRKK